MLADAATPHPMTLTQKILASHAIGLTRPWVQTGDMLQIRVDWTIASELAWNGMDRTYTLLGRPQIHDPKRFYLALDHTVDPVTLANDARARKLADLSRDFAKESGIQHFYDANVTIMHTKFYRDLVQPGEVVLGADSHTSSHGGLGAFAIGLGGADVTAAMVLGQSWIEVPGGHRGRVRGRRCLRHRRQGHHPAHAGRAGPQHRRDGAHRGVSRRRGAQLHHRHALHHLQHDGGVRRAERHL